MPRGNIENFKGNTHKLTAEEQSQGGKKSGETRREKKQLKDCLDVLLERVAGKDQQGNELTGAEMLAVKAFNGALTGDWKAWELVRDTAGQKPIDKVAVASVDAETMAEVEKMVKDAERTEE